MTRVFCTIPLSAAVGLSLLVACAGCSSSESEILTPESVTQRLVFQVGAPEAAIDEQTLDKAYLAIQRRLLSTNDFIREVLVEKKPPNQIVVSIRNLSPEKVQSLRRIVIRPGGVQFALLANRFDHPDLIARAEKTTDATEDSETAWFPVAKDVQGKTRELYDDGSLVTRETEKDGQKTKEVLIIRGSPKMRITEEYLKFASWGIDESGNFCVNFTLTDRGGYLMQHITGRNGPTLDGFYRKLAIILEGAVHTAPVIHAPIGADAQFTGDFSEQDLDELVIALNGGRLPAPVQFVESQQVGAKE